jgi:Protein of unknown function (DUF559)
MLPLVLREQVNPALLRRARELRQHMTPEERSVGQELHGNRLGVHFRRPQPLVPYIIDCYCPQARLVVESEVVPIASSKATTSCATATWPASEFACCDWPMIRCATLYPR